MDNWTVYTTRTCPYCRAAKDLLTRRKIPFKEVVLDDDEQFDALIAKTGWKTVPQIFFGERLIGGYRELVALEESGALRSMIPGLQDARS